MNGENEDDFTEVPLEADVKPMIPKNKGMTSPDIETRLQGIGNFARFLPAFILSQRALALSLAQRENDTSAH